MLGDFSEEETRYAIHWTIDWRWFDRMMNEEGFFGQVDRSNDLLEFEQETDMDTFDFDGESIHFHFS